MREVMPFAGGAHFDLHRVIKALVRQRYDSRGALARELPRAGSQQLLSLPQKLARPVCRGAAEVDELGLIRRDDDGDEMPIAVPMNGSNRCGELWCDIGDGPTRQRHRVDIAPG